MSANPVVLGFATVGFTAVSKVAQHKPPTKVLLGGILYVGALSLLDMGSPEAASALAWLVFATAFILNGVPFFQGITRKVA